MPVFWSGAVHDRNSERQRLRAYAFYCGLIWRYAEWHDRIGALRLAEPSLGRPMPVVLRDRLISQDLAMASLDLNAMAAVIDLAKVRRVLEIGAGYGRLSYMFASLYPGIDYVVADIAPALAVAKHYLPAVCAGKFSFVLPRELDAMPEQSFDLIINVSSLDEMPPAVQQRYIARIDRLCGRHLYLSGHYYRRNGQGLDQLNFPASWRLRFNQRHDVFPRWVEKLFSIR